MRITAFAAGASMHELVGFRVECKTCEDSRCQDFQLSNVYGGREGSGRGRVWLRLGRARPREAAPWPPVAARDRVRPRVAA